MAEDFYKTLGVSKEATKEEIKKAYKKLAMKYHPDRASKDKKQEYEEKFKEINEAASVLGNDEKRANYDKFGSTEGFRTGFEGFDFSDFMHGSSNFEDIFSNLFGGGGFRHRQTQTRGADLYYDMRIELEEAATGIKKEITITKKELCDECHGSGAKSEEDITSCDQCNGAGRIRQTQRTPFGIFSTTGICSQCHGSGKTITEFCSKCHGKGVVNVDKNLEVNIPEGIDTGFRLRLAGEGETSKSGISGDLFINIHIDLHEVFQRTGDDLFIEAPLSFSEATLGTEIKVKTIDGHAKLKIPAGTQTHTLFKMKNKGMPHINSHGKGSQFVKVIIKTPEKLNKKEKELFKQLQKQNNKKSLFEKFKGRIFS